MRINDPHRSKNNNPNTQEIEKLGVTHERGLEKVLDHENLIGRINSTVIDPTLLNGEHAVNTRKKNKKNSTGDGLDHNRTATALEAIDGEDHKLPERGLEGEEQYENHLRHNDGEQKMNHLEEKWKLGILDLETVMGLGFKV